MGNHDFALLPFPTNDPKDPLRWPSGLKFVAILVTSSANFVSNIGGAGISVAIPLLMEEYHKSQSGATQVLTLNFLFLSIGNIFWVPVAMKSGKRTALLSSMALQTGMFAWTAAARSFHSLLAAMCLQGFAAAAGESIVPEIVADTTFVHRRGAMMSIYILLISGGSAIGPLIAGFMTTELADTWRSFMCLCCGAGGLNFFLIFSLYPESNFTRPELDLTTDQLEMMRNRESFKANENIPKEELCEDVKAVPLEQHDYTIHNPSFREILPLVSYNTDVNFLKVMFEPLKLLIHPSYGGGFSLTP
ncbi:uncharacterized protein N7483_012548 [Penicillium malachiteum]|uniref:uncharacterized protein n=1 Tax=Penicillium malachiteum TaxID=1324776 RepID=UPI002546B670|nr:uncharacterized protein N7483_012548 [Penicillium malachiteum]KAJ5715367.1 hypothetical protein N7483_012548 [Penicillium malachiteum]